MATGALKGYMHEAIDNGYDFAELVRQRCRLYGALITMRDMPGGVPIPEEIKPNPYHKDELADARAALQTWIATPEEERRAMYEAERKAAKESADASLEAVNAQNEVVRAWLAAARTLVPASDGHREFCAGLVADLEESLLSDRYFRSWGDSERASFEEWRERRSETLDRDVRYHAEEWEKEVERAGERTEWLRGVARMIEQVPA